MINLLRVKIGRKSKKIVVKNFFFINNFFSFFANFLEVFEISNPIFFVIFGFPSTKKFFSHWNALLSAEKKFDVQRFHRKKIILKSSPPDKASQDGFNTEFSKVNSPPEGKLLHSKNFWVYFQKRTWNWIPI